jgi:hypothetical protein
MIATGYSIAKQRTPSAIDTTSNSAQLRQFILITILSSSLLSRRRIHPAEQ